MASKDRNTKGQFVPGHTIRGNRTGRPKRSREDALMRAFTKTLTIERMIEVTETLIQQALWGDISAIRLLFQYGLGVPVQRIEAEIEIGNVVTMEKWLIMAAERRAAVTGDIIEGEIVDVIEGPVAPPTSEED